MTATEPVTRLTDEARALADAQPAIDVTEVGAEPGTDIEPAQQGVAREHGTEHRSSLEAAADAALMMPGVPGRDEFLALAMTARILSLSAAAPAAVRDNPHLAFHVAMVGRDLGISPSASLELIDILEQRKKIDNQWVVTYQLSLSPQLLNGQVRRLGLGSIVPAVRTPEMCVAYAVGPRGLDQRCARMLPDHADDCRCDILGTSEFTWDDARIANLVGPLCEPGAHKNPPGKDRCGCNQGYKTYPRRMMWWRAAGFATDDFFPEAGLGLYSPEELGAVVDDEGRPIDPSTVELPAGYDTDTASEPAPATDEQKAAIKARIDRLPPPAVAALAAEWSAPTGETLPDGQPKPTIWPMRILPAEQVPVAEALIDSITARARKGEWGTWAGGDAEGAPDGQAAPEAAVGAQAPEPAPEAATGDVEADEVCYDFDCDELAVLLDDDERPWCADHCPAGLATQVGLPLDGEDT